MSHMRRDQSDHSRSDERTPNSGSQGKRLPDWARYVCWLRVERLEDRCLLAFSPLEAGFDSPGPPDVDGADHDHEHEPLVIEYLPPRQNAFNLLGYLTEPSSATPLGIVLGYMVERASEWDLAASVFDEVFVTNQYVSAHTEITHVYLRQEFNGLEIANANLNANVDALGRLLNVGGGFVPEIALPPAAGAAAEPLTAAAALEFAAAHLDLALASAPILVEAPQGPSQAAIYVASDISLDPIPVRQHYVAQPDGLALAWDIVLRTPDKSHWYNLSIDAHSGELLLAADWVSHATYRVFALPTESPIDGVRTLLTDPHDALASPFGWHDTNGVVGAEFTDTRGNNVFAQEDTDANNTGGTRPSGGAGLNFDFSLDLTQAPSTYQDAANTNLFYWNNILHDIHYQYGFTEVAGNFQQNNYGRGGVAGDPVQADLQDGSGTNNANFATPPDGFAPRMQMFVFTLTSPHRDSALDNGVIVHEYGHGVSNRLTGGAANSSALNALQSRGMGEGWSDFWALMFMQRPTDGPFDRYTMGNYVLGQSAAGPGIRRNPYSLDLAINPANLNFYNSSNQVHNTGEIWASALWDLNWLLIAKHGYNPDLYAPFNTGGNNLTLQLVMDGLKLQPANPTFMEARDAILLADTVLTGGANHNEIWQAFARRGMGFSASAGANANSTTVVAAFDLPPTGPPLVSVSVQTPMTFENASQNLIYTFTRAGSTSGAITVNFDVSGAAEFGSDYTATSSNTPFTFNGVSGTVTIAAGSNTAVVTIDPTGDTTPEPDETVILTVAPGVDYSPIFPTVATAIILNDDTEVSVTVSPASVLEDGAENLVFTFTRSGVVTYAQTVNFSVSGTASFPSDYTQSGAATFGATAGTVVIPAGAASASVTINPTTDLSLEPDETVVLTVTAATLPPAIVSEIEPNDTIATAQNLDTGNWNTSFNANIGSATANTSTAIPHITVSGTGNSTFDYYSFTVLRAGARAIFDIDGASFDTEIFFYSSSGVLLAENDDSSTTSGAGGSTSGLDSFLEFTFSAPGTYVLGVGRFNSVGSPGGITGNTPPNGGTYTLHISLTDHTGPGYTIGSPAATTGIIANDDFVDLQLSIIDVPDPVTAGSGPSNLQHLVTVTNNSVIQATGIGVDLAIALPTGVVFVSATGPGANTLDASGAGAWNLALLPPGASATLTVRYTVGASAAAGALVTLTADNLRANEPLTNLGDDAATESTTIERQADLRVTMTESIDPVVAGTSLTYVVTVLNNGPSDASGIVLNQDLTLPAGVVLASATASSGLFNVTTDPDGVWNLGDLPCGQSATLTIVVDVAPSAASGTNVITSTATIATANEPRINTADDTATNSTSITRRVELQVATQAGVNPAIAGSGVGNLVYEITVTNVGPSDASGVILGEDITIPAGVIVDSIVASAGTSFSTTIAPDGTWTVGGLPSGESATLTVVFTVTAAAAPGANVIRSTTTVTTANETRIGGGETSTVATSIGRQVDLVVEQAASGSPIVAGTGAGNLTYVVTVTNAGPSNASNVVVSEDLTLPAGVTLVSITPSAGSFSTTAAPGGT